MSYSYPKLPLKLKRLIGKLEGPEIEFKENLAETVLLQLSKTFASFANSNGGLLVIGVNNEGAYLDLVRKEGDLERISQAAGNCDPPVMINQQIYHEDGKEVLIIDISSDKHVHRDVYNKFPIRIDKVTGYMDAEAIILRSKEKNQDTTKVQQYVEYKRKKIKQADLLPYLNALSGPDLQAKAFVLGQLATIVSRSVIEVSKELLPHIVKCLQDENTEVKDAALVLYERMNFNMSKSDKKNYAKTLFPLVSKIALTNDTMSSRRHALRAIIASGEPEAVGVMVKLITNLSENDYIGFIDDNTWIRVNHVRLGSKLSAELAKAFLDCNNDVVRERIRAETKSRYLGDE